MRRRGGCLDGRAVVDGPRESPPGVVGGQSRAQGTHFQDAPSQAAALFDAAASRPWCADERVRRSVERDRGRARGSGRLSNLGEPREHGRRIRRFYRTALALVGRVVPDTSGVRDTAKPATDELIAVVRIADRRPLRRTPLRRKSPLRPASGLTHSSALSRVRSQPHQRSSGGRWTDAAASSAAALAPLIRPTLCRAPAVGATTRTVSSRCVGAATAPSGCRSTASSATCRAMCDWSDAGS